MNGPITRKHRRPHLKSRTGCTVCRQRRVKEWNHKFCTAATVVSIFLGGAASSFASPGFLSSHYAFSCVFISSHSPQIRKIFRVVSLIRSQCDETRPACQRCLNRGQACSYPQSWHSSRKLQERKPKDKSILSPENPTIAQPTTVLQSPIYPAPHPLVFSILDLELLHFWTTNSCSAFVDFSCITLFQTTIVQLAFTHRFLLHEVLSLAAIHLSRLQISSSEAAKYRHASSIHLASSLNLFQSAVSNLSAENCHACFAFSTMIFMHCWAAQDTSKPSTLFFTPKDFDGTEEENWEWVKLHRGAYTILQNHWLVISTGPLKPLFAPWTVLDFHRPDSMNEVEAMELDKLSLAWKSPSSRLSLNQREHLDEALEKLKKLFSMLDFNAKISKLSVVMTWFLIIPGGYLTMLKEKIPEAMLLVTFYCVLLKRLDHVWWVAGKAENLLRTVVTELENTNEWRRWLQWPVEQIMGKPVKWVDYWKS